MDNNFNKPLSHLNVLNWNANGIKSQQTLFTTFLTRYNIDIACISETHLTSAINFKASGYRCYRDDRVARFPSGGVAILVKQKIIQHEVPKINLTNLETVAVKIKTNDGVQVKIIAVYRQPNKQLLETDLYEIFNRRP